jgi:hypothetical protein
MPPSAKAVDPASGFAIRYVQSWDVVHDQWPTRIGDAMPDRMLQFFVYDHLPPKLQEASKPFCDLAADFVAKYPMNPERTVMLRKLLEAKDAAVRMVLETAE